jgi:hypothetical protein
MRKIEDVGWAATYELRRESDDQRKQGLSTKYIVLHLRKRSILLQIDSKSL